MGQHVVPTKFQWFFWGSIYLFFGWTLKLKFLIPKLFMGIQLKEGLEKVVEKYFRISLFFSIFCECLPVLCFQVEFGHELGMNEIYYASLIVKLALIFSELLKNLYRLHNGDIDFSNCFDIMNFIIFICIPITFIMTTDVIILMTALYGISWHW